MGELEPCKCRCGAKAVIDYTNGYYVRCTRDGCKYNHRPPNWVEMYHSKDEAIAAWNRKAQ